MPIFVIVSETMVIGSDE